uniref:receptor-type tyrosine-protein phosphatase kappa-like isoform X1 n=1 Tax=Myxine glutinosa TaxID=7769 RepID=UPI00359015BA
MFALLFALACSLPVAHLGASRLQFSGSCTFEEDFGTCGYRLESEADWNWEQVNAKEFPALESVIPYEDSNSYMLVNVSGQLAGERALLLLPRITENDTHCLSFSFLHSGSHNLSPGTLNVYVAVNAGLTTNPIWNVTHSFGHHWSNAELAISTFWPNSYQVIFEVVASSFGRAYVAVDDIQLLKHPCGKAPHFLRLGNVEVNAGQNATFQCIAAARAAANDLMWLQRSNGRDVPVTTVKAVVYRRFAASFDIVHTSSEDADRYRCVTSAVDGAGVSNFAELIVKEPPTPVAPPQLMAAGATYLLIQLNANSIAGDGPVVMRQVEYRMPRALGGWAETHAVGSAAYKLWHLEPDTEYEVRVLLTRPGEGGTGPPGPALLAHTKCAEPTRPPRGLEVSGVWARQVSLVWERVGYNVTRCHNFSVAIRFRYNHFARSAETVLKESWVSGEDAAVAPIGSPAQHTLHGLPPYSNISLRLALSNSEGQRQTDEIVVQTDEDVPGSIPVASIRGDTFEERIFLQWGSPLETNGVISLYEITYHAISSFEPSFVMASPSKKIYKLGNETSHLFSGLYPGTGYGFTLRASTLKGYGPPVTVRLGTNISAPFLPRYGTEDPINETETTITVLLEPAASKGAPISAYQLVVQENRSSRLRRDIGQSPRVSGLSSSQPPAAAASHCFYEPIGFQSAVTSQSSHYFAAELPPAALPAPLRFTVGDNNTYNGFWNAPLVPEKSYDVYFQAVSQAGGEIKIDCVRVARKGASSHPPLVPASERRMDGTARVAGITAGSLALILLALALLLILRRRKMAKKRKEGTGGGSEGSRQEMTLMVQTADKNFGEQNALQTEEPLAYYNSHSTTPGRYEARGTDGGDIMSSARPRSFHRKRDPCESPYVGSRPHPAIRVSDLLQHIEHMKSGEAYRFKEEYESFFEGQAASWDVAKREENRPKNRYGNIIAYDHSRVVLETLSAEPHSDYINANYIDGYYESHHYIATQGPIPETVYDFWRMIWQERSTSIVMVTNLVEVGRVKCCKYWPDASEIHGDIKVTLVETEMLAEYMIRTFSLHKAGSDETRQLRQFHFTGWPDHGVPYHATGLLAFIRRVKSTNAPHSGPVVVHCSAGAGRTGCFIVIDIMMDMAVREGLLDIYNCVCELRSRRINMVQTEEQYVFIHDAMLEACLCGDTAISVHAFRAAYPTIVCTDPQSGSSQVKDEFQTLNMVTPTLRSEDCSIALLPRNHEKNRYRDLLPPDRCLPFLITINGDSSNYINAALVDSYRQPSAFIVTQHPLPSTVKDFWRLVFDYHCTSIVMLNELDLSKYCPQYWPEEGMLCHGPIQVEFVAFNMEGDIVTRTFRICNMARPQDGCRMVEQFQYLGWPSGRDVPSSRHSFLRLVLAVERWQDDYGMGGRTAVHCQNGAGRSGTFCAVSIACDMVKRQDVVDVFHAVKTLRNSKPNIVDSLNQYQFCYEVMLEYLETV